jgi:hypothetical protein
MRDASRKIGDACPYRRVAFDNSSNTNSRGHWPLILEADTMKYLLLLNRTEDAPPQPGSAAFGDAVRDYGAANAAMAEAGVLVERAPLSAVSSATTVRVRDGETLLTDGPSAEIKELLGGYTIIECADLDDAIKWASTIPAAKDASVVIRPIVAVPSPV